MRYIITQEKNTVPSGFRNLTDDEISNEFLKLDVDKSYFVSKNEWMMNFIQLLFKDMDALEKEGPDSLMTRIQELSDEFDKYDLDNNKYIDYIEYKNFVSDNIYISE
ncbi:MAG: hypothetical protein ACI37Q_05340 [Candidatus Gastranaerophilaceae bacterium]